MTQMLVVIKKEGSDTSTDNVCDKDNLGLNLGHWTKMWPYHTTTVFVKKLLEYNFKVYLHKKRQNNRTIRKKTHP